MAMMMMGAAMAQDIPANGDLHLMMIFVAIGAISLLVIALIVLGSSVGGAVFALKLKAEVMTEIADLKAKVMPLVATSHSLVTDLSPKINDISTKAAAISANVESISVLVREKLQEFGPTITAANETLMSANQTARVANAKAQDQIIRVNGMVSSVLDATENAGKSIQRGINVPVREVSGILSGLKAGWTTFLSGKPKPMPPTYRAPVGTYQGSASREREPGIQSD